MTDEILNSGDVSESTDEKPEQKVTDEKKFTQKELDTHIQTRLKKEKDSQKLLTDSWDSERKSYEEKIEGYEKIFSSVLDAKKEGLDEDILELLSELDSFKQLEYLNKFEAKQEKIKDMPMTPQSKHTSENNNQPIKFNNFLG
jgi:hypothetical protein